MKTLNQNIVCIETDEPAKLATNVYLPELEKKYTTLKVVEPDVQGFCKKDDILYVPYRSVTKVKVYGKDYQVVNARDILFIV